MRKKFLCTAGISVVMLMTSCVSSDEMVTTQEKTTQAKKTIENSKEISVYYGNTALNETQEDCSVVFPVARLVSISEDLSAAALKKLFLGPTPDEVAHGYYSQFSYFTRDALIGVKVIEQTAYVNLIDVRTIIPNAASSCASAHFFAEIEATLAQFEIQKVLFAINGDPKIFYEWMQMGCTEENENCGITRYQ